MVRNTDREIDRGKDKAMVENIHRETDRDWLLKVPLVL